MIWKERKSVEMTTNNDYDDVGLIEHILPTPNNCIRARTKMNE